MSALSIQLPPDLSRRVIRYVDRRRTAMGWTRGQLAEKANARLDGGPLFTTNLLDAWYSKARLGVPQRIDLDKALVLLAVCGHGSNRLDELVAELGSEVASLVDDADGMVPSDRP